VLTSETHPLRVDWIAGFEGGRLGLTFAPGKHQVSQRMPAPWARDLEADLARLRGEWRADVLVCLLEDDEMARLRIAGLVERAEAHGLRVLRLPIRDGGVPREAGAVVRLVGAILAALRGGERVVVHCAGGLGRTGTIAGCCLVAAGVPAERALEMLRATRGPECPENEAQRAFVRSFQPA
jgi:protein-tyrosine phosphatase